MRTVPPPPVTLVTPGTLLAAADTPGDLLARDEETGYLGPIVSGWDLYDPCGDPEDDRGLGHDLNDGEVSSAMPWVLQGPSSTCTVMSMSVEDLEARARAGLAAIEDAAIAHEFWTGALAVQAAGVDPNSPWLLNPRLEAGAAVTDVNAGGAVSVRTGLGLLEQALSGLLGVGVLTLHAAVHVLPQLADYVRRDGALLLTQRDTRVVLSPGYPGTSPLGAAAAAGQAWVYGTARPTVRRGPVTVDPVTVGQVIDPETNRATVYAHRLVHITLPAPDIYAVRVTLT